MKILSTDLTAGSTILSGTGPLRVESVDNRSGYGHVTIHAQDEAGRRRDLEVSAKAMVEVVSVGRRGK